MEKGKCSFGKFKIQTSKPLISLICSLCTKHHADCYGGYKLIPDTVRPSPQRACSLEGELDLHLQEEISKTHTT